MRGTFRDPNAMTATIKNPAELSTPGKTGTPSQNSESKTGPSPRANPVCLEVSITMRSLPTEPGGSTQPTREEARTVIVFDNGAVIRSATNMPAGQTVILSNPNRRDVVCRVVGGRNLPSVKGYVEVEFMEPVSDFWGIHKGADPVGAASPAVSSVPLETAVPPPPAIPRAADPIEVSSKKSSVSVGSAPTFDDLAGVITARESKTRPERSGLEMKAKDASDYNHTENASPTPLASWASATPESAAEKRGIPGTTEPLPIGSPASAASHDFLSKGLMAYEQPQSASSTSIGRTPLIVGVAAVVLTGVCAVAFFMNRRSAPASVANTAVLSHPPKQAEPPAVPSAPEPTPASQGETSQAAASPVATQTQTPPQPVAIEQAQPMAGVAPVPAIATSPVTSDSRPDQRNARRQEKSAAVPKQAESVSAPRPAIPNLKIGSPSAPSRNIANLGDGAAPITEAASPEAVGTTPPAGLLTSSGRISNPPAAPPSMPAPTPAPKIVRDAKLISSARPVYPPTAKQTKVQGIVTVSLSIDANGRVIGAKALSGPLLLRQAAIESVQQWKYSPATTDGKPTPSEVIVNLEFKLN